MELNESILIKIIKLTIESSTSTSTTNATSLTTKYLTGHGRALSSANLSLLYEELELNFNESSQQNLKLNRVLNDESIANRVQHLRVVRGNNTVSHGHSRLGERRESISSNSTTQFSLDSNLEDLEEEDSTQYESTFLTLLTKLPNLLTFSWDSTILPPNLLCSTLSQFSPYLTNFKINLLSSPTLRYDAPSLYLISNSLTNLSISNLSHEGALTLSKSFLEEFQSLESLELIKTVYVDDSFMEGLARGSKKLQRLRIVDMGGTKLTDKGMAKVVEELVELEEIVLDSVEGESFFRVMARGY